MRRPVGAGSEAAVAPGALPEAALASAVRAVRGR
ncbi:uncharacterized protein SOCE836_074440 [Sorangium cellulosum]|uniref:Uncharacterized protein n=1 Tax=Sorangium cellulosum TaxID=56 RepID=A0A4P2QXJ0_SORCE|nr:uncharacterized protein SOCE836_074440 [Sorangium cellulosum]WCQ94559.1 hypothetical protein NQZ70_07327 [Sorangium sp. Soce836]